MRRKFIFAIALLLVVGAALWGVNYRLDHPPLTQADKEFRALVAGADSMKATQASCQNSASACANSTELKFGPLNAEQTREIIGNIRPIGQEVSSSETPPIFINLMFYKNGKSLYNVVLFQSSKSSAVEKTWDGYKSNKYIFPTAYYQLNPRFNKRLNRTLDAYLPQRVRP